MLWNIPFHSVLFHRIMTPLIGQITTHGISLNNQNYMDVSHAVCLERSSRM